MPEGALVVGFVAGFVYNASSALLLKLQVRSLLGLLYCTFSLLFFLSFFFCSVMLHDFFIFRSVLSFYPPKKSHYATFTPREPIALYGIRTFALFIK